MMRAQYSNDRAMLDMTICQVHDATAVWQLEQVVRATLSKTQQVYLKARSIDDYQQLVEGGSLHGVYLGAQLVALLIFTHHHTENYKTDFNPTKQFCQALGDVYDFGILGGLMVHPAYRGHGLAHRLIATVMGGELARDQDCLFAETVVDNVFSINCFVQNGFNIVGREYFPALGVDLCLLRWEPQIAQNIAPARVVT